MEGEDFRVKNLNWWFIEGLEWQKRGRAGSHKCPWAVEGRTSASSSISFHQLESPVVTSPWEQRAITCAEHTGSREQEGEQVPVLYNTPPQHIEPVFSQYCSCARPCGHVVLECFPTPLLAIVWTPESKRGWKMLTFLPFSSSPLDSLDFCHRH